MRAPPTVVIYNSIARNGYDQFRDRSGVRPGEHSALITNEVFAAVAKLLDAGRTRFPGTRYEIEWPLQGRLYCTQCDRVLSLQTNRY